MQGSINIKVREIIAGHFGIDPARVTDEARFRDDLGADWLDRLEVMRNPRDCGQDSDASRTAFR
jgi:acyl carrier protein